MHTYTYMYTHLWVGRWWAVASCLASKEDMKALWPVSVLRFWIEKGLTQA